MKSIRYLALGFLSLIQIGSCELGFDVVDASKLVPKSSFECLLSNKYEFFVQRIWQDFGIPDPNAKANIENARAAGYKKVEGYVFPCRADGVDKYVPQVIEAIKGIELDMIWLDIEGNPTEDCNWSEYSYQSNCDYIVNSTKAFQEKGQKNIGIYTTNYEWAYVTGWAYNCPEVSNLPLWYERIDNKPTLEDYSRIGGWLNANRKQFTGYSLVCGLGVDKSYQPDKSELI